MTKLASILLSGFLLTVTVAPALANPTAFAEYVQAGSQGFGLTSTVITGNEYSVTITGSGLISFNYNISGTPFDTSSQFANLSFTATSTFTGNCPSSANCTAGSYTETGFSGSFSIIRFQPFNNLSNLLSGTFSVLQLNSTVGGNTGALEATTTSSNPNQLVFTSDFLSFADIVSRDARFSLTSLTPVFSVLGNTGVNNGFPLGFTAMGSGVFIDDPNAPEPSTFALLAIGLLGVCVWQRKRRLLQR